MFTSFANDMNNTIFQSALIDSLSWWQSSPYKAAIVLFKAAPWDDINFRFYFRTEVVYPTDHVFIFFRIFIFL